MINRAELLDPTAYDMRSDYEKSVIEGAHNAGHGPRTLQLGLGASSAGTYQQFINPAAIRAAECSAPGCDSDISDGLASLEEAIHSTSG